MNAKKLILWRGHHSQKLFQWIDQAWKGQAQLVIVPPLLNDFSFLKLWNGPLQLEGHWSDLQIQTLSNNRTSDKEGDLTSVASNWPTDTCMGLFTSGTLSGKPRMVLFTKENLTVSLESIRKLYNVNRIKQIFCYPQPTHVFGFVLGYLQSYLYNVSLIAHEDHYSRESHKLWLQTVHPDTLTLGTPAHLSDLLSIVSSFNDSSLKQNESFTFSPSYSCILGGAPVNRILWKRVQNELQIEAPSIGYGATEASLGISHLPPGVEPPCDSVIGSILPHVEIQEVSSLGYSFSGPNVAKSILDDNQFIFPKNIFIKDVLSLTQQENPKHAPYYIFEGRADLIINRGGLKISPELVESLIESEFGTPAIVVGYPNDRLGHDMALLFQPSSTIENLKTKIHTYLSQNLGFKPSTHLMIEGEIPKTNHGKKDRSSTLKIIIRQTHPQNQPIPISLIKSFMPHRNTAIWIDQIDEFKPHFGKAQFQVKKEAAYWPLTGAESVEWIAQAYGYARVACEIYGLQKINFASKTLIAEVKTFENLEPQIWEQIQPGDLLSLVAQCTYDFTPLFVVEGEVIKDQKPIAKVNLKVYAGP